MTTNAENETAQIIRVLEKHRDSLLEEWLQTQIPVVSARSAETTEEELRDEAEEFITHLQSGIESGDLDHLEGEPWVPVVQLLTRIARKRLREGFPVRETAIFVTMFKEPLFRLLTEELGEDNEQLARLVWTASLVLDRLSLRIAEVYLEHRERIIERQRQELLELSTPVVKIWDGVVALPLIGTLDSSRTQVVMESLLESIVEHGADVAILDITGVPTVDTQVAQNLMKAISAARLIGAECMVSGIRPQIAQTLVRLGVSLENIQTRSSLADAIAVAFRQRGYRVERGDAPRE